MASDTPFRVFVGTERAQLVPYQVLAHSIRVHSSIPVEITPMIDLPDVPEPQEFENRSRTGFSLYRFAIPRLCGYQGKALYLDADMLVFADIAELDRLEFGDAKVLVSLQLEAPEAWRGDPKFRPGPHAACMLLDCGRLDWRVEDIVATIDRGTYSYADAIRELALLEPGELATTIPTEWNHLEVYEAGVTRNLHYTVVSRQPWKVDGNPLEGVWIEAFRDALAAGAVDPDDVIRGILGHDLKPSLAAHLTEAPGVSDAMVDALVAMGDYRAQATELAHRNDAMVASHAWKLGSTLTRTLAAPRAWLGRG